MKFRLQLASCFATCLLLVACDQKQEAAPVDTTLATASTTNEPWATYESYAAPSDAAPDDQNGGEQLDDAALKAQLATQVMRIYEGPRAAPILDDDERAYRTRILQAAADGVNFAGASTVVQIGCGTGCSFAYVINQETGDVRPLGLGGEEQMYLTLMFEPDQRLLGASWENGDQCIRASYLWNGSTLDPFDQEQVYAKVDGSCDQAGA